MSLINKFHQTIVAIGMDILEHPVFYKAPIGIRFEIGGKEDVYIKKGLMRKLHPNPVYVNEGVNRALTIFHALPRRDWMLRIDVFDENEIKKIVKILQFVQPHEKVLKEYEVDREQITHYELYWALDEIDWSVETIIREIVLADIGGLKCLASSVYFVHTEGKLLYHLYDDRGLDVVAQQKSILSPLYETFNDWILDHDRESIDKIFTNKQETVELVNLQK